MPEWRVLIVEDDVPTRDFFADSVSGCGQLHLVAGVGTFEEARALIEDKNQVIDILLTDLALPDGNGLDLIRLAGRLRPSCEALVISMFGDEDSGCPASKPAPSGTSRRISRRTTLHTRFWR